MKKLENTLNYSKYFNFYIFGYFFLLLIFVYQIFLLAYDTQNQNSVVDLLSYTVVDPPWLPNGTQPKPYLYNHFFGDLQANVTYAQLNNPYQVEEYPWPFPPLSIYFYRFFSILGNGNSYIILILTSVVLHYITINKILKQLPLFLKLSILIITGPLSIGWIINFDRGAVYSIVFPLTLIAFIKIKENKYLQSALIISIIISVKPQFIIILVLFLVLKKFKIFLLSVGLTVILNIISWINIGLSVDLALRSFKNLSDYHLGGSSGSIYVFSSISFNGLYAKILEYFYGFEEAFTIFNSSAVITLILNICVFGYFVFSTLYQRLNLESSLIFWLPLVAFLPQTSQAYASSWASTTILLVIKNITSGQYKFMGDNLLFSLILISIVPNMFTSDKFIAEQFLLQFTSILIILYLTVVNLRKFTHKISNS